ncbi:MAG: YhbY family RNA-binding protein [Gemmatimonadetes bacterium]|jgi:RNA-binding protein|nr:YhbY family RNA-binding protein [Gemmatimonadota bacterium]
MTLSSKERAELRAEAHHLTAMVHIGHHGLTDALRQTLDDALRTHELVKVALTKSTEISAKDAAHQLAEQLGADVVQTIGRTCTLYRENPDLERKKGAPPPWR